jgi:hypothetical protein
MTEPFQRIDGGGGKAAFHVQRVARLAETEAAGQETW